MAYKNREDTDRKNFIEENKIYQPCSKQIKELQTFWKQFYKDSELNVHKEGKIEAEEIERQIKIENTHKWEIFKRNRAIVIDLYLEMKKRQLFVKEFNVLYWT